MSSDGSGLYSSSKERKAQGSVPDVNGTPPLRIGRYALYGVLASGGMATVHLARLLGEAGFSRTVAIKRLHPNFAQETEFVAMLLDEARLVARIRHPNVVPMLDVVREPDEVFLVMEYIHGESLSRLIAATVQAGIPIPLPIVSALLIGTLNGLHAAHEARNERGEPLGLVHRDVSPQNVIVGTDGVARVLDFGVAKATGRLQSTQNEELKGKLGYMAPEQIRAEPVDRRADVWSAAVVLWETLTCARLFRSEVQATVALRVLSDEILPPSRRREDCPPSLDDVLMRGLSRDVETRWASAEEMAHALEEAIPPATPRAVGEWVRKLAGEALGSRAARIEDMESRSDAQPALKLLLAAPVSPSGRSLLPAEDEREGASSSATAAPLSLARSKGEPSRSRFVLLLAPLVLVVLGFASFAMFRGLTRDKGAVSAAPPGPSSEAREPPRPDKPAASAAPEGKAPEGRAPAPTASASAPSPRALALKPPLPQIKSVPVASAPSATPKTPTPSCDPPYTIGPAPDFIKKPKLECLK